MSAHWAGKTDVSAQEECRTLVERAMAHFDRIARRAFEKGR
jgi:hypothetical protein